MWAGDTCRWGVLAPLLVLHRQTHIYENVSWVYLAVGGAIRASPAPRAVDDMPKKRRADALSYWGQHCHLNTSSLMLIFSALRTSRDGKSILWYRSGTVLLLRGAVIRDKAVRWQDGSLARWGDCVSCVSEMARYMKLTSDPMDRPIELRRVRASSCYRHCLV